jgi:hypothetical protein
MLNKKGEVKNRSAIIEQIEQIDTSAPVKSNQKTLATSRMVNDHQAYKYNEFLEKT